MQNGIVREKVTAVLLKGDDCAERVNCVRKNAEGVLVLSYNC